MENTLKEAAINNRFLIQWKKTLQSATESDLLQTLKKTEVELV